MAKNPQEIARQQQNADKDSYYYNQEFIQLPQVQQSLLGQQMQQVGAMDQWYFNNMQTTQSYNDFVEQAEFNFGAQVDAYIRSDEAYRENAALIQEAFDNKANQLNQNFAEIAQGIEYDKNAAQRQYNLQQERAQLNTDAVDIEIAKLYEAQRLTNNQILRATEAGSRNLGFLDARYEINKDQNELSRDVQLENENTNIAKLAAEQQNISNQIAYLQEEKALRMDRIDFEYENYHKDAMNNMLDLTIQSIQNQGASAARGQSGKSVKRTADTIKAMAGVNQAKLTDGINRAAKDRALKRDEVNLDTKRRSNDLDTALSINKISKDRSNKRKKEINDDFKLTDSLLKVNYDKDKADEKDRTESSLEGLRSESATRELQVEAQEKQIELIAAQLGFDYEQMQMTKEQLGASLRSAADANRISHEELRTQAKQANTNAYYSKMARPVFAGVPSAPYAVPPPMMAPIQIPAAPPPYQSFSDLGLSAIEYDGGSGGFLGDLGGLVGGLAPLVGAIPGVGPLTAPIMTGVGGGMQFIDNII